jgi:hypothetical protein
MLVVRQRRRRVVSYGPAVEVLEGRWLPSTVTSLADAGPGSLREAIANTPSGGTVDFQSDLSGTITLTTGELLIDKDLTIAGPGAGVITVSGNHAPRVFNVPLHVTVGISGLRIANGMALIGGGITNFGTLLVTDCTLADNSVSGFSARGGAISCSGTKTVINCTFSGNSAIGTDSVSLASGGAITNNLGALTITDSTFTGNFAQGGGFGYAGGIANDGGLVITNSTLSGNSAGGTFGEGGASVTAAA